MIRLKCSLIPDQLKTIVFLSLILFLSPNILFAQIGGPPPTKKARLVFDYITDTLMLNSPRQINGGQRVGFADLDLNIIKNKKYILTLSAAIESLNTGLNDLEIGESNTLVNNFLTNQSFEISGTKFINDKGKSTSIIVNYGSASDNPFGRQQDSAINLTALYSFERQSKSQWSILANFSNNRAFLNNIPLPSFLYLYMPTRYFTATMGFPFVSFRWMDFKSYVYSVFLTPSGAGFDLAWRIFGPAMFYTKFRYMVQTFMHENRIKEEDRLFYEDKKLEFGINSFLSKTLKASIGLGYSFDRKVYEGESIFNIESARKNLSEDFYLRTNLTFNF